MLTKEILELFKKLNRLLNLIIGSFIGAFIGHDVYRYWDYCKFPGLYDTQSALWFTSYYFQQNLYGCYLSDCGSIKIFFKEKIKNDFLSNQIS